MRYVKTNKKRGFTVMESIVAFTILSLSVTAFSGIIVNSMRNFRNSQEKYVAAKIAQEGMELAVNKKDNNVQCVESNVACPLSTWQENLIGSFKVESARPEKLLPNHVFDDFEQDEYICVLDVPPQDRGKFGYCPGQGQGVVFPAQYTREIAITSIDAQSVRIQSIVRWGDDKSIVLEAYLFSN